MSLLEMRGISKAFNGVPVLKEVQLTVEEGEVHALLGENGAGKSTLMNVLTGTIPFDAGTILFEGQELKNLSIIADNLCLCAGSGNGGKCSCCRRITYAENNINIVIL